MDHNLLIVILMIGAGFLGGATNFLRAELEKKDFSMFLKNVLMGISASILIPFFLNMISSSLLKETTSDNSKLFVFFGFCLIASLSSKAFIQTMSDRVMSEIKDTKEKMEGMQRRMRLAEVVVNKETEPEPQEGEDSTSLMQVRAFSFSEDAKKTLNALGKGKYAWRSVRGIAREVEIPREKTLDALNWLLSNDLVVKSVEKGRWGLTIEGRDIFTKMFQGDRQE
jgi:hypothetical protein